MKYSGIFSFPEAIEMDDGWHPAVTICVQGRVESVSYYPMAFARRDMAHGMARSLSDGLNDLIESVVLLLSEIETDLQRN